MSILDNVGLTFVESMAGYIGVQERDPREGAVVGQRCDTRIRMDVKVAISDLGRFLEISQHAAALSGTVTCEALGGLCEISDGTFNLFPVDPASGMRQMIYTFRLKAPLGRTYYFHGHKEICDDRQKIDLLEDMTRLFVVIYEGPDAQGPVYGAGEMRFKLADAPSMFASMKVVNASSFWQEAAARMAFIHFACGVLREEYLKNVSLFYETRYENLVLSGVVQDSGGHRPFFLVSGVHDKGFPWGDGETFWDVLLAIGDGNGGYDGYAITDRVLDGLAIDVERGTYRYQGPLYRIRTGYGTSFTHMRTGSSELESCTAQIDIAFEARPYDTVPFPFPTAGKLVRKLSGPLARQLREAIPTHCDLGINITPHAVRVRSGGLSIARVAAEGGPAPGLEELKISAGQTFGEAEVSTFNNLREPAILYGYICAVRLEAQAARVQIHSRTLRDQREHWARDQIEAFLGTIVSRVASAEIVMEAGTSICHRFKRSDYDPASHRLFHKLGDPLVEVANDHYPTAVFLRRIVKVQDPSGQECLALEEDMSLMRREAIGSDKKTTVAAIRDDDKFLALDKALAETEFDRIIEEHRAASHKTRADYSIVIKANFMFAYDKNDRSTYTDPELVGRLAAHLHDLGFENVAVVEAQSTYGEYFTRRSVREMAAYLGFDGKAGYRVIDMTEDATEQRDLGPHLGLHPVSTAWRDADFRISFAKNKTHAYAYYTQPFHA